MDNLQGTILKGYQLEEQIGNGGFGVVYRASQKTVGREVAVKIILPDYANNPDFIRRFESEAQLVARLEHPHITPLHDFWRDPTGAYLVMRYLRGGSVQHTLQDGAPDGAPSGGYELSAASQLLDQIASALDFAHRHGVIHRDIKPGNILLDEDGNAYLADFGIAKDLLEVGEGQTAVNTVVGSLDYISPEQARSEAVTPRTDIYSLGITLYEMITGEHPFPHISAVERLYKHINEPIPTITTLPADLCDTINTVLQRATAKNPQKRYPDVLAFAAAFREALGREITVPDANIVEQLTLREQEILALIAQGKSNREIADLFVVTLGTVKWHITQLYKKLGVRSRVQAIFRARELNLIVGEDFSDLLPGRNGLATAVSLSLPEPENPYKGLHAFQITDARDFFGRDTLIQKLITRLCANDPYHRFLAIIGPSGSGKSSLVKAGLIPALWRGAIPGSEKWFVVDMMPGTHPLDKLETALIRVAANQAHNLRDQLQRDERGLLRVADIILPNDKTELVIVIDQFEELFTLVETEETRQHFLNLLRMAVSDVRSRVHVIVTLRADYYDRPLHYPEFGDLIRNQMETVLPLSAKGLERAVRGPAERVGVTFEQGLVEHIVSDMNYQSGALPLLQYALTELFDRRNGRLLTHEAYQQIGGAVGALAHRADEIYHSLTDEAQALAQQMFLRLVILGQGAEDSRRRITQAELLSLTDNTDLMEEIIDQFAAYRLLSLDHDPQTRQPTVEVAHEAILREWDRLRHWLNESRDDIRQERAIARAAHDWEAHQREVSFLLHGARLEEAQKWQETTRLIQTPLEQTFIQHSLAQQQQERETEFARQARENILEKRSRQGLRALVAVLAIATIIAVGLSIFAFAQRNQTARQSRISLAQSVAALAALVLEEQDSQQELATLLALEAARINGDEGSNVPWLVNKTLRQTLGQPYFSNTIQAHEAAIWWVAVAPDSQTVASASADNTIRLWDMNNPTAEPTILRGHQGHINAVAFSPNGRWLASASADDTIRLWDRSNLGNEPTIFTAHQADVWMVAFTPDGQTLASSSRDNSIRLWDMANLAASPLVITKIYAGQIVFSPDGQVLTSAHREGQISRTSIRLWDVNNLAAEPVILQGHQNGVMSVAFSPDGQVLASGDWDGVIHLRDRGDLTARPVALRGHRGAVMSVAFSPDGQTLASGGFDNSIRLWDVDNPATEPIILRGHETEIFSLAFAPDGRTLVSSDRNGVMRLWNVAQPVAEPVILAGHHDGVRQAIFAPDGQMVASASWDDSIRLWDATNPTAEPITLRGHGDAVLSLAFAPDGQLLATGSADRTVRLWDVTKPAQEPLVLPLEGWIWALAFAPDGQTVASGGSDGRIHLWDSTKPAIAPWLLAGHEAAVLSLAFAPDGQMLASASLDKTVRLWDLRGATAVPRVLTGHEAGVNAVAFSPDGKWLASAGGSVDSVDSVDNNIRLWDMTNLAAAPVVLIGHSQSVHGLAFAPDGQMLASAGLDHTVRLWAVAHPAAEPLLLAGHEAAVWSVAFSPDGQRVLSASSDKTVRLWMLLDELLEIGCQKVGRNLSLAEWQRFVGRQEPYHPTCANLPLHPSVPVGASP